MKVRLIACVMVRDGWAVQSVGFNSFLPVGRPEIVVEFLDDWGIDEIVLLDIGATSAGRCVDTSLVEQVSKKCFVPLTIGGGITKVSDVHSHLHSGADKVLLNAAALNHPELIGEIANIYGSQCVVVCVDSMVSSFGKGDYRAMTHSASRDSGLSVVDAVQQAQCMGAGEILINSIDCDGKKQGYDLELMKQVVPALNIPVIACGGAGHPDHFRAAIQEVGVQAVAAGNYFHFTEHSVMTTKSYLRQHGVDVRVDDRATYSERSFMEDGRLEKQNQEFLASLRFVNHPEEII